jgi:hypothetical protein
MESKNSLQDIVHPTQANPAKPNPCTAIPSQISSWLIGGLCLLMAALFLLIASKSSPLYPFNDWTDANTFLTMGRGMVDGKVPYRDLFEQKGPLLYLLFAMGSLVSRTTFLGVFLLEVLSFAIFLFISHRLIALYVGDQYALLGLPLLSAAVLNLRSFGHGGSAEQFTLPLVMFSLYSFMRYFKQVYPQPMSASWLILNGFVAGCSIWIKYSFAGFWLGWFGVLLLNLVSNRHYIMALKSTAFLLAGLLIATLPWIAYFGIHGAIADWFEAYFIINLTAYPVELTLRERIMVPIDSFQRHLSINPLSVGLLTLGVLVFSTNKKFNQSIFGRIGLIMSLALLFLGIYGGGRDFNYYFLIFAPFIVFGFVIMLDLYAQPYGLLKSKLMLGLLLFLLFALSLGYTLRFQRNTYMLHWSRADQVQYRFAAIINQTPNATLLNYGGLDYGFFTAAGITPNTRFYQAFNIDYGNFPLVMDEQNRYIQERIVDFVVLRVLPADDIENLPVPYLYENYQLFSSQSQLFGDTEFSYLLFARIK